MFEVRKYFSGEVPGDWVLSSAQAFLAMNRRAAESTKAGYFDSEPDDCVMIVWHSETTIAFGVLYRNSAGGYGGGSQRDIIVEFRKG